MSVRMHVKNKQTFRSLVIPAAIVALVLSTVSCSGFKSAGPHGSLAENSEGDGSLPGTTDLESPGPETQLPSETPVPPVGQPSFPPATKTTYAALSANILLAKCTTCHNVGYNARPGVTFATFNESVKNVIPGKPLESDMYRAAKRIAPPSTTQIITAEQLQYIYDWILEGAQNN